MLGLLMLIFVLLLPSRRKANTIIMAVLIMMLLLGDCHIRHRRWARVRRNARDAFYEAVQLAAGFSAARRRFDTITQGRTDRSSITITCSPLTPTLAKR